MKPCREIAIWLIHCTKKEMTQNQASLRTGQKEYHDRIFEEEINQLINATQEHYEK